MATSINIGKQSVLELLTGARKKPFVIPEYQRPYAWSDDEVVTLFEDLWEFTKQVVEEKKENETYFLGTIVSYETDTQSEIIDGQQRITSLLLLLRAIYTRLSELPTKTDEANNFISKIGPAIWKANPKTGKVDFTQVMIKSNVVSDHGNEILQNILETGEARKEAKDNYSKNYLKFLSLYDNASKENWSMMYDFILALLDQAIVLPITADSQDTALTIFSTLNNRGLPLSDADIFKAKIYNHIKEDEKQDFIDKWKMLEEDSQQAKESIQSLFYYYMFYLRAKDDDNKSTTPGLRKYFLDTKYIDTRLYRKELMDDLFNILNIWKVVNVHDEIDGEPWSKNGEIKRSLDILSSYQNEFWKYPIVTFYLTHKQETDFEETFLQFINKLAHFLLIKYIEIPTINAVKADIVKLNVAVTKTNHPEFKVDIPELSTLKDRVLNPHRNIIRMLLKMLAYKEQNELLPTIWEIEHILPQKWQKTYFPEFYTDDVIYERIEHIGNKLPLEKIKNIVAGNNYLDEKKKEYIKSDIEIVKQFAQTPQSNWRIKDIENRDEQVYQVIEGILKKWDENYNPIKENPEPTPEDIKMIEHLKRKGLI